MFILENLSQVCLIDTLHAVLYHYAGVLPEELGTLQRTKVKFLMDSSVPQKSCKPHSVPFAALRQKVETEMQHP